MNYLPARVDLFFLFLLSISIILTAGDSTGRDIFTVSQCDTLVKKERKGKVEALDVFQRTLKWPYAERKGARGLVPRPVVDKALLLGLTVWEGQTSSGPGLTRGD